MGKIALEKKEIEECFNALHLLSQNNFDSKRIRGSFSRFPNGFFINDSIDADSFFTETIKEPSRKDKLSKLLSSIRLVKKLGTTSFEIAIPSSLLEIKEKICALKMINDSLILWTDNFVYKIPATEKAVRRTNKTKDNLVILKKLDTDIQELFLIPQFIETSDMVLQCSVKCLTLSLDNEKISEIDNFLNTYFSKVFQSAELQNSIYRGLQHGDLHFRNLLKRKNNKLCITDLDLIEENGFPFLDLMHFAIHLTRTIEKSSQYQPFESFLKEKSYLYNKLKTYNFYKISEIWLQYYHDDYIALYIQSQIEWYHYNKATSDELIQLEKLQKKYVL